MHAIAKCEATIVIYVIFYSYQYPSGGFSGISINGQNLNLGVSGFYGINYDGGQIYFTGSQYTGSTVAATGCIKDFNIYLNNSNKYYNMSVLFRAKRRFSTKYAVPRIQFKG